MPCFMIFILIFFHECGHFLMAYLFGFDIDKIYFYPWGGISKFTTKLNVSLKSEFIVLIAGPLFQMVAYFILKNTIFFSNYLDLLKNVHYSLILFNLFPIYPLDGGRLLNILFNIFFSFKKSLIYTLYFSIFSLFCFFLLNVSNIGINLIFILCFLFYKICDEKSKVSFYMDKFLLERYLCDFKFKKRKTVNSVDDFSKGKKHLIHLDDRYYSEREFLLKKFKK